MVNWLFEDSQRFGCGRTIALERGLLHRHGSRDKSIYSGLKTPIGGGLSGGRRLGLGLGI